MKFVLQVSGHYFCTFEHTPFYFNIMLFALIQRTTIQLQIRVPPKTGCNYKKFRGTVILGGGDIEI